MLVSYELFYFFILVYGTFDIKNNHSLWMFNDNFKHVGFILVSLLICSQNIVFLFPPLSQFLLVVFFVSFSKYRE